MRITKTILAALAATAMGACCGGCGPGDPVTVYESVPVTRHSGSAKVEETGEPRFRMITAIHERPDATWFFKLTGAVDAITDAEPKWKAFLKSVRFDAGNPEWDLPDGWTEEPGNPARFATLRIGTGASAPELSITSLPPGQPLGMNLNRWRGQLGLPPLNEMEVLLDLEEFSGDGAAFKVFDARGPRFDTGMGPAPMANLPQQPPAGSTPRTEQPASGAAPPQQPPEPAPRPASLDYDEPAGWTPGNISSMVAGRWTKETGEGTVELSLLSMNPTDESWQLNLEAWSNQVGLESPADVDAVTQTVTVGGANGRYARLDGPAAGEGDEPARSIVVAMFQDGQDNGWVVRLAGSTTAVDQTVDAFDAFLKSIAFR
jgi:hypothetical protein